MLKSSSKAEVVVFFVSLKTDYVQDNMQKTLWVVSILPMKTDGNLILGRSQYGKLSSHGC